MARLVLSNVSSLSFNSVGFFRLMLSKGCPQLALRRLMRCFFSLSVFNDRAVVLPMS